MSNVIARLLPLLLLCLFHSVNGNAQPTDRPPALNPGDAVVTGFSGISAPDAARQRPRGKSAADLTFINPDGPSARIVDLARPGYVWDGRLFPAAKKFDVFARDVGQVFGVALDDQPQPNIYVAATSVYGLHIVVRGRDGLPERRKKGGPGAGWMQGQFGLDLQGGPGGIYRIDGRTGAVTLFANVTLDGVPNPGPGIGNLAYDFANKQLFASDLYTGMIHRFDLDGRDLGSYDHGVTGLGAARLPPVVFNPRNRPNIASERFDSESPATWGFAPAGRQVWGLAVNEGRLYYSVSAGPQIWSVGINRDGSFASDPRWELDVPAQSGPLAVSDMTFSRDGAMILAQRALIAGSYDFSAFTRPGGPQVLRFSLKGPNAPPSPGRWTPVPDEYAVGLAGSFRNTNGGVALGYGYGPDGMLSMAACEAALWTTGQNLRNNPALRSQLEPGGPLLVEGLQGGPIDRVRRGSEPPAASYFIDYDDVYDDARVSGHMGSVRILAQPCTAVAGTPRSSGSPPYASGPSSNPPGMPPGNPPPPPPPGPTYDLSVKKTAGDVKFDPATLTWTVTFTVIVTNNGLPFSPGNTISINDPAPPGMTFTGATGAGWTCGGSLNCGYAFGSGVFNTGASLVPLVITATSKTPGSYQNCANVATSAVQESTYVNNRDCVTVDLKYPPNCIQVEKVNLDPSCAVEMLCRFQIIVRNLDPWPFSGPVTIADNTTIPMNIAFTDVPCPTPPTSVPFSCTAPLTIPASGALTFSVNGVIPAGSVPITGVNPDPINCATISQPPIGTTIVIPQACLPYKVPCGFACHMNDPQIAQIKIEKAANSTVCSPGGLCSYTYTISNVSTTMPTGLMPITFIDTMPAGATNYVSSTPPPWGCVPFGGPGQIKCLYPPSSIPPGGQIAVTITFQISPGYNQPTLTNCSEFFIGQTPPSMSAQRSRAATALDATALRTYLQGRGLTELPQPSSVTLQPDDKSCATVNISDQPRRVCAPPKVPGAVPGQCVCPAGTVQQEQECIRPPQACPSPKVPGAVPGQCVCPAGTVQQGQECIKPPQACPPPKVPGAVLGQCVCPPGTAAKGRDCVVRQSACPDGTVRKGSRCVEAVVCRPPAKLRRGVCQCPTDMVASGNSCVARERRQPIIPDGIRNIPGGFGLGGGGRREGGGGGGAVGGDGAGGGTRR